MARLLEIPYDAEAVFLQRPNRFLGLVDITWPEEEGSQLIHVHDPGRLPDLLVPGSKVLLKRADSPRRKTAWDLLAVKSRGGRWVFVNSIYHRRLVEVLWSRPDLAPVRGIREFKAEVKWGNSRLDFELCLETGVRVMVEVKGCTLARGVKALFPDAPTLRGARHLEELIRAKNAGLSALLLVLVFREEATCFGPCGEVDPGFAELFKQAFWAGVDVVVLVVGYDGRYLSLKGRIPVCV